MLHSAVRDRVTDTGEPVATSRKGVSFHEAMIAVVPDMCPSWRHELPRTHQKGHVTNTAWSAQDSEWMRGRDVIT